MKKSHSFLTRWVYNINEMLSKTKIKWLKSKEELPENDEKIPQITNNERKELYDILSINEFLKNRAIVWNLVAYTVKEWWKDKLVVRYDAMYWLNMDIYSLNSFIDFCSTHWFIPMIDKIIINDQDVSSIKDLYGLFVQAMSCKDWVISNILFNEIDKLNETYQDITREVLPRVQTFSEYIHYGYQYMLWEKLSRMKNTGTISENIFAEVAINLENQVREYLDIKSTYIKLWSYQADTLQKTDLNFVLRKTPNQSYQTIPIQLTVSTDYRLESKAKKVEQYLLDQMNNWEQQHNNFIILSIDWEFRNSISDVKNENRIADDYKKWLDSPLIREKNTDHTFPLFIKSVDHEIIKPAEIIYIALHMLYKKFDFKNTTKESYIQACKKLWKIDKSNTNEIHWIKISDIFVSEASVERLENKNWLNNWILKHKYIITYHWEKMWTIIVYWM